MRTAGLPRLCYLGSIPVEATSAGPMQLSRVLGNYPPESLRIIEAECVPSVQSRRLERVRYDVITRSFQRGWYFARMRLPLLFWKMLELETGRQSKRAASLVSTYRPEAIVTIHEGFAWYTAFKLAQSLRVPLHLILHDEWFRDIPMHASLKPRFEAAFGNVYRTASNRFCVSPYMGEEYAKRFGAAGTVLYPIRGAQTPAYPPISKEAASGQRPFTVAYAGNVWHRGNWENLRKVAEALDILGGQLVIIGPTTPEDARRNQLVRKNVVLRGVVNDLVASLRAEGDVLFVPMTFENNERRNMQISFPSKLTDYTAAGLPLLIYGPDYSSGVRWARENPGSCELVTEENLEALLAALKRLTDSATRETLAQRALEVGNRYFSFEHGTQLFESAIMHNGAETIRCTSAA